ncbi:MAG: beta-L-arabinofuranosidase domain-containing protein [Steroidobacteraceae bacterium]
MKPTRFNRREAMLGAAALAISARSINVRANVPERLPAAARALPLSSVRLRPSDYATAVETNRVYLRRLEPDRLLHNFRQYAGLSPKAPAYGGWEGDTIAGHTTGHYLSALALCFQQSGDEQLRTRARYIVDELSQVQTRRGTGYLGALGRKRKDGTVVDGEEIFAEISAGDIRASGFDLNGAWSPLYTIHKLLAGLLDAHGTFLDATALRIASGLAAYIERVFAPLTPAQVQQVLVCEYGGLNESYAELYARTGERRWLKMAELLRDERVIAPLERREDLLANLHANTQVPKMIGLARLHELTGSASAGTAAAYFWETVTRHHSYVIGGNSDREYFSAPDSLAASITEQTCEHCNTYNMLKLTRMLWSWQPDGALFDFYERAHLNHVMAAHDPVSGRFTYMTPLMSGAAREFSGKADDDFWCCVGTGMESHSKHGDSIFWEGRDGTFYVNLYIAAHADWALHRARLTLDTRYPFEAESRLHFERVAAARFPVALRVPAWAGGRAIIKLNGQPVSARFRSGYAIVERAWRSGDMLAITLPLELRLESTPGDAQTVAVLQGPLVLAADLGSAAEPWSGADPALVGESPLAKFSATDPAQGRYQTRGAVQPSDQDFAPFYRQYQRRSAVYFRRYSESDWSLQAATWQAEQSRQQELHAHAVDVIALGEEQAERDHQLSSAISYPVVYRGRHGRDARAGGYIEFTLNVQPGPLQLRATYWGGERARDFDLRVDGKTIASQHLDNDHPGQFFDAVYPVEETLTNARTTIRVRIEPHAGNTAGPVFGVALVRPKTS